MLPQAIPAVKKIIRESRLDECQALSRAALQCAKADEVSALLDEFARRYK
jgi:phosphoenolpyruvate-protein kinase (PTS system EI component)